VANFFLLAQFFWRILYNHLNQSIIKLLEASISRVKRKPGNFNTWESLSAYNAAKTARCKAGKRKFSGELTG
jgi:hypothetical protein